MHMEENPAEKSLDRFARCGWHISSLRASPGLSLVIYDDLTGRSSGIDATMRRQTKGKKTDNPRRCSLVSDSPSFVNETAVCHCIASVTILSLLRLPLIFYAHHTGWQTFFSVTRMSEWFERISCLSSPVTWHLRLSPKHSGLSPAQSLLASEKWSKYKLKARSLTHSTDSCQTLRGHLNLSPVHVCPPPGCPRDFWSNVEMVFSCWSNFEIVFSAEAILRLFFLL